MESKSEKLVLKIYFVDSYRTIAFEPEITVKQASNFVKQKLNLNEKDYANYGLYLFHETEEKNTSTQGIWLPESVQLAQSGVHSKSHIEFRSRIRFLKVTNVAHETVPLKDLFPTISQQIGVEDFSEFSLQTIRMKDTKSLLVWMDMSRSISEQYVSEDSIVIYRKKFHVTDNFIESQEPNELHLLYLECKHGIVSGQYMTSLDQALAFSAMQMQVTFGNYDPLTHVAGFLPLNEYLSPAYSSVQFIEEDVYRAHRKLKDLPMLEVKHRYIKECLTLPAYGITIRTSRETTPNSGSDSELIVGVSCDAFFTLHVDTKDVITRTPLMEILAFGARGKLLQIQCGSSAFGFTGNNTTGTGTTREFLFEIESDALLMTQLIAGYINFKKNKRKEHFAQNLFSFHVSKNEKIHEPVVKTMKLKFKTMPTVGVFSMAGLNLEFVSDKESPNLSAVSTVNSVKAYVLK